MIPIAVLASGRGSNLDAIMSAIANRKLDARIVAVVSDQPKAAALDKARAAGIPAIFVPVEIGAPSELELSPRERMQLVQQRRVTHERAVLRELQPLAPRFLVMAGYMRVVTPLLIEAFRSERGYSRIVNVHPSLLPSFPGVGGYAQAFHHGAKLSGVTVHLVEEQVDDGPICAQEAFSIADCRTAAEVEKRGLTTEHRLFPETLSWVLPENFTLEVCAAETRRFRVRSN